MIAVTCRNGEHFSIDPDGIERVEASGETVVHMVDGSKYVIDQGIDELVVVVRDHRAAAFVARNRLVDGFAATPAAARHARRVRTDHRPIASLTEHREE